MRRSCWTGASEVRPFLSHFTFRPTEAERIAAQDERTHDALAQARAKARCDLYRDADERRAAENCKPHGCGVEGSARRTTRRQRDTYRSTKEGAGMSEDKGSGTLAEALVAAQMDMPAVEADQTNPFFKSRYVTLGHLMAKVRPVLNRHGLMVAQFPSSQDGKPTLVTLLIHESGERIEYEAPLVMSKNDAQAFGSAVTYARRYALASALGISDQEDDDGNAGTAPQQAPEASQKPLTDKATATGLLNVAKAAGVGGEALSMYLSSQGWCMSRSSLRRRRCGRCSSSLTTRSMRCTSTWRRRRRRGRRRERHDSLRRRDHFR